jgi:hypothetical protein
MDESDARYYDEEVVKESKELGVVALDYNRFASFARRASAHIGGCGSLSTRRSLTANFWYIVMMRKLFDCSERELQDYEPKVH